MDLPDIVNMYFDADSCNDTDALSETLRPTPSSKTKALAIKASSQSSDGGWLRRRRLRTLLNLWNPRSTATKHSSEPR